MRLHAPEFSPEYVKKARAFLVRYIKTVMNEKGFSKIVIGLSGGMDSSLGAYLAVEALGKENVLGILMPYKKSNPESLECGKLVCEELDIKNIIIDITPMIDAYFQSFPDASLLRKGNKMARERMSILFDQSNIHGSLVMGTSNKSEYLLGYGTIHGDLASAFNPLGAIYKTEVWMMGELIGVPKNIIDKEPSADLWVGQTDEDELGIDYPTADRILYYLIDKKADVETILSLGVPNNVARKIMRLIEKSEFKRHLPDIPTLSR